MHYGPSRHRQIRILITSFEDGSAEVRFHEALAAGKTDEVVVEFTGVIGRFDDAQPAIRDAALRARTGDVKWLRPETNDWIVDGDALRGMTTDLANLSWLTGTATITPRYEPAEMLRAGTFAARGSVILRFDEQTWAQSSKPWERNWTVRDNEPRSGGQGTVRRVESRAKAGQFGALKVLHDQHQTIRERRYRLLREVQALEYMAGKGTPYVYESNAAAYNDHRQILYAVTAFIDGPTLSKRVNQKRFDITAARTVTMRLADTLECLHRAGHKHRDLKPDNVILRNDQLDDPVLVDFGMASAGNEHDGEFHTQADQEVGNRFLRLPEYAADTHRDDPRSDITQLVALMFYMITGITPRVLVDSEGRKPHEREHERLTGLRQRPEWPRLRQLFDIGFNVELDKRVPDLPTLRQYLHALTDPFADAETQQEIDRLARAASNPSLRSHAEHNTTLSELSHRFTARVRDILHNTNATIETEERDSPGGRNAEVSMTAHLRDHTWPHANVRHSVSFNDEGWHAAFHADDGQPITYLTMPITTDRSVVADAIDQGAARVVKNLLRYLNYKVERIPVLRRAATGTRTPLTDLSEEYPIGISVTIEDEAGDRRLALRFQNNSGVTQPQFDVLLLFPLALKPTIDSISSTQQEEKYDRFSFTVTTPLQHRATVEGPVVHVAGDPTDAPAESHIFFQLKVGDSQYTRSIKVEEVFGPPRGT